MLGEGATFGGMYSNLSCLLLVTQPIGLKRVYARAYTVGGAECSGQFTGQ